MPSQTTASEILKPKEKIGRLTYLLCGLPAYLIVLFLTGLFLGPFAIFFLLFFVAAFLASLGSAAPFISLLYAIIVVYSLYIAFRMAVLRLRDLDKSGYWSLLLLVPVANVILATLLLFRPGDTATSAAGETLKYHAVIYWLVIGVFLLAGVGVLAMIYPTSALVQSLVPWTPQDDRPAANERVETIGPTPESERAQYKQQARYNNNINFYYTKSGDAAGYSVYNAATNGEWYYVENNLVYGPFSTRPSQYGEPADAGWKRLAEQGWNIDLQERWRIENTDSKNGHTAVVLPKGPEFSCFDSSVKSQSAIMYDEQEVGVETIQDGRCQYPVEGVVLSDDGLHYAYLVRAKRGYFVVVDGKKSAQYPMISNLHFEGSAFVFNAVSSDFLNFVRATIN